MPSKIDLPLEVRDLRRRIHLLPNGMLFAHASRELEGMTGNLMQQADGWLAAGQSAPVCTLIRLYTVTAFLCPMKYSPRQSLC